MQRFGGERIKTVMGWSGLEPDAPLENKLVTKSIGSAQTKVESYHFDIRKHLLDYDDVLNKQREVIYADRYEVLDQGDLRTKTVEFIRREFADALRSHLPDRHADHWNADGFIDAVSRICEPPPELATEEQVYEFSQTQIDERLHEYAETAYAAREEELGDEQMRLLERLLLLRAIDTHWVQHLTAMENLRTGIGLHAYGQRDPLVMYRTEGQKMFQDLQNRIQGDVAHTIFRVSLNPATPAGGAANGPGNGRAGGRRRAAAEPASPMQAVNGGNRAAAPAAAKVGRNSPCPCGSGRKYKRCHGGG